jgi:hypothetical protein
MKGLLLVIASIILIPAIPLPLAASLVLTLPLVAALADLIQPSDIEEGDPRP